MNVWKLYKNCKILKERNFKVDYIETYLATLDSYTYTRPQYFKNQLNAYVKISFSQEQLAYFGDETNYNYMSISNDKDTFPSYYFILKKEWISPNTIGLTLELDTVNTFTEERGSIQFSSNTLINRQHKDRYVYRNVSPYVGITSMTSEHFEELVTEEEYNVYLNARDYYVINGDIHFTNVVQVRVFDVNTHKQISYIPNAERILNIPFTPIMGATIPHTITIYTDGGTSIVYTDPNYIIAIHKPQSVAYDSEQIFAQSFVQHLGGRITFEEITKEFFPLVDIFSEGYSFKTYKRDIGNIERRDLNLDWYLIYRNQNNPTDSLENPVNCFICASENVEVKWGGEYIYPSNLVEGKFYYFINTRNTDQPNATIRIGTYDLEATNLHSWAFKRSGDKITAYDCVNGLREVYFLINSSSMLEVNAPNGINYVVADYLTGEITDFDSLPTTKLRGGALINSINSVDRTDAKLIKIIKLPYPPLDIEIEDGKLVIDDTKFSYNAEMGMLRLLNLNTKFDYEFDVDLENPLNVLDGTNRVVDNAFGNDNTFRNIKYETKLFHSDYYQPKLYYDSFSLGLYLETVDIYEHMDMEGEKFKINFTATSTINSKCLFTFPQYICGDKQKEDFNNIINTARNNDITIYNQQYINYLRAGFNYDVKVKNNQNISSFIPSVVSILMGATSVALGHPVVGGSGIVGGIAGLINAGISTANRETSFEGKLATLKQQATSVEGADDVDLMSKYCNNRLRLSIYEIDERKKKMLGDLFHFAGYINGTLGVPNTTSRKRFNFISCNADFIKTKQMSEEVINNIKMRYNDGVSVIHYYNNMWDFERVYENWEVIIDE